MACSSKLKAQSSLPAAQSTKLKAHGVQLKAHDAEQFQQLAVKHTRLLHLHEFA